MQTLYLRVIKNRMKKILCLGLFLLSLAGFSQNVGINGTAASPDASAMLDVAATNKGMLIPRVSLSSTSDVSTIATPLTSLMVYNTNASMTGGGVGYYYYDGSAWIPLGGGKELVWTTTYNNTVASSNLLSAQTVYFHNPTGALAAANEALTQIKMTKSLFTRLRVYVIPNTLNGTCVITVRKNGVNTALTLTVTAATTGYFEITGAVPFNDGDLLSVQGVLAGSSGNIGFLRMELSYY